MSGCVPSAAASLGAGVAAIGRHSLAFAVVVLA